MPAPPEAKERCPDSARERDELLHRLHRHVVVHDENIGRVAELRDRSEIPERIKRHLLIKRRVHDQRPGRGYQQRVAIRHGFGDALGADIAGGAAHVLDHGRPAQGFGELVGHQTRDDVRWSARRKRDDHADRPLRIVRLRQGAASGHQPAAGDQQRRQDRQNTGARSRHRSLPALLHDVTLGPHGSTQNAVD